MGSFNKLPSVTATAHIAAAAAAAVLIQVVCYYSMRLRCCGVCNCEEAWPFTEYFVAVALELLLELLLLLCMEAHNIAGKLRVICCADCCGCQACIDWYMVYTQHAHRQYKA